MKKFINLKNPIAVGYSPGRRWESCPTNRLNNRLSMSGTGLRGIIKEKE